MIGAPRSGKSTWLKTLCSNLSIMRPNKMYEKILYCNPNLKTLSAKDELFTKDFEKACKNVPVEFSSELPTSEKINSFSTDENSRVFIGEKFFFCKCFSDLSSLFKFQ